MKKKTQIFLLVITLFLAGCSSTVVDDMVLTEEFESAVGTAIIETIAASLPKADDPPEQPSPTTGSAGNGIQSTTQPTATLETVPTHVTLPTKTTVSLPPTSTSLPAPCYRAELIEETVPDGTKFTPGKWFAKTWIIRNTGVCEWTEDFRWVLVEGEDFSGVTDVTLNRIVLPGEDLRVLLELKAPLNAGAYKGTYQILTETGASVTPLGFWVTIVVE